MKKILVVDNKLKQRHPDPGPHGEIVDFFEYLESSKITAEIYATAFVHDNNDRERSEARKVFNPVFSFSGGTDSIKHYKGLYSLPVSNFIDNFGAFLDCYVNAGGEITDEAIDTFKGRAHKRISTQPQNPPIRFSSKSEDSEALIFPIIHRNGDIDFEATLAPLQNLKETHPIFLNQQYLPESDLYEGLDLLIRLRLYTKYPFSRFPVYVRLKDPLEKCLRSKPAYLILCTEGTYIVDKYPEKPNSEPITQKQQLSTIKRIPQIRLKDDHDLSNEWGPLHLWNGFAHLTPNPPPLPKWALRNYVHLLEQEFYASILAIRNLEATPTNESPKSELDYSFEEWVAFLEEYREKPLSVLLVDDEMEQGWDRAVGALFDVVSGAVNFDTHLSTIDFETDFEQVEKYVLSKPWDLVLCDLRLKSDDHGSMQRRIDHLYGTKIISRLKGFYPQVPVIAFTASNKAWSLKYLSAHGIDGYWVKESPLYGLDENYSIANVIELLKTIDCFVTRRKEASTVWDLYENIARLSKLESYKEGWREGEVRTPDEVEAHLDGIICRLLRAYWFLIQEPTHFDTQFGVHRYNQAFLAIWSIINEACWLYYDSPTPEYYGESLAKRSSAKFRIRNPKSLEWEALWILKKGKVIQEGPMYPLLGSYLAKHVCPTNEYGIGKWPTPSADMARIRLLLRSISEASMEDDFDSLRELRNHLADTHGHGSNDRKADITHIETLIKIWKRLLVAPFG